MRFNFFKFVIQRHSHKFYVCFGTKEKVLKNQKMVYHFVYKKSSAKNSAPNLKPFQSRRIPPNLEWRFEAVNLDQYMIQIRRLLTKLKSAPTNRRKFCSNARSAIISDKSICV